MESSSRQNQAPKVRTYKEIPSSLDLLPMGARYTDSLSLKLKPGQESKFAGIKSRTDSGLKEAKSVMRTDDTIRVTRLKGEYFGRIAHNVLSRYIEEGHSHQDPDMTLDPIKSLRTGPYPAKRPPLDTTSNKIVLLDMRSREEYVHSHIKNALSFPAANVQIDFEFSKLNLIKNHPDTLLVIYLGDERHGILQARVVFEKGFDNVYLLSGGFLIFAKEHPELLEGACL